VDVDVWSENLSVLTLYIANNTEETLEDVQIHYDGVKGRTITFDPYEEVVMEVLKLVK
jgi:hypothetical protein